MVREVAAVAAAQGIAVDDSGPLPALTISGASDDEGARRVAEMGQRLMDNAPNHRMSTLQDLDNGKRLEVDETLGYLARLADQAGVEVPVTRGAWQLITAIDRAARA